MPLPVLLFAVLAASPADPAPPCRPQQLRVSLDGRDGDFNGMSHSGIALSIRNRGRDCTLPALPRVEFRDARGHVLPAVRQPPVGMHPGPAMVPVRIGGGHRATTELRWVSGPVYDNSRSIRAARVTVRIGSGTIGAPLSATLYGPSGKSVTFDQSPLRVEEGMAGS